MPGPPLTVKRTTVYLQDPSSDEGAPEVEDVVHLVRAAAGRFCSTPVLQALLQQGAGRARELKCTPDTRATRTQMWFVASAGRRQPPQCGCTPPRPTRGWSAAARLRFTLWPIMAFWTLIVGRGSGQPGFHR